MSQANPKMTKEQAIEFFAKFYSGKHHIPSEVKPFADGWKVAHFGDMSTFDFDDLTRLVFMAHDRCVRVSIMQSGPGRIGIAIWQRAGREGEFWAKHPTIENALEKWRTKNPQESAV